MTQGLTGVVLAGGRSSRFGSNKALAPWRGGTLTSAVVSRLCAVFQRVLIVGKDASCAEGLESRARFVDDGSSVSHPLVGITRAMEEAETDRIFVTACDMPSVDPALIRALCEASSGYAAATAVWEGRPQPLCAVYSRECAGVMRLLLEEGRPVRELFSVVATRFLSPDEVEGLDPAGATFLDIDTPEEYRIARELSADA